MKLPSPFLWVALFSNLWILSLAGVKELRLPVPTSETIALVAREMGAATFEESLEEEDSQPASSETGRRVQRKLVTGGEDIDDNVEYQEYQGVMGRPGVDFPVLPSIPSTSFSCRAVRRHGYFADLDTDCQVFHICDGGRKISFLCPNGTIFRQSHLICDWWFRVDCGKSVELYEESAEQLAADQRIYRQRAEAINKAMGKGERFNSPSTTPAPPPPPSDNPIHIDAPAFETAKLNFESRQNSRRQNTSRRRKQRPRIESQQNDPNNSRQQFKSSEDISVNGPVDEEREQQVLSETASFASNRGNQFSKQFYRESYFTASSPSYQNSIAPSNNAGLQSPQNTKFVSESTTVRILSSTSTPETPTFGDYVSSTEAVRKSPQKNFRGKGRLFPTSSQNNNIRPSPSRNRQVVDSQRSSAIQQSSLQVNNNTNYNRQSSSNFYQSNSQTLQNNIVRPSPDLVPPQTEQNNQINIQPPEIKLNSETVSLSNHKSYVQLDRNKTPSSSTIQPSPPNRFSSPTTQPPLPEETSQQRFKQRRFTSTTEKPIFTVKFRPSKTFSYVELERSQTSSDLASTTNNFQSSSTALPLAVSSINNQVDDKSVSFRPSTQDPVNSVSSVSYLTSKFSEKPQFENTLAYDQSIVTEVPLVGKERQEQWAPTRSPSLSTNSAFIYSSSSPTPSYSPTIPDQSRKDYINSNLPSSTPFIIISKDDTRHDKLQDFRNIDPAEINQLPFKDNTKSKHNFKIPEPSGQNALHTLALYYATSESDSGITPSYVKKELTSSQVLESDDLPTIQPEIRQRANQQTKSKVSDEILLRSHSGSPDSETEIDDSQASVEPLGIVKDLPTVLTKTTKDSYAFLFNDTTEEKTHPHTEGKLCNSDEIFDLDATKETITESISEIKDDIKNDLYSDQSRGIVQPTSTTQKPTPLSFPTLDELPDELKLKDSTDLRELAQVFSRALSAYLEDPDSFRRILSEVRPTEPTNLNTYGTTLSLEDNEDEVLDFSDASSAPRATNNINDMKNQKDRINQIDIEQINDLVQTENTTYPELSRDLTAPKEEYFETFDSQRYSKSAASLAADINLLSRDTNNSVSTTEGEVVFFPTAGGVEDQSRPRYGGFHNNSAGSNYKPYGSEISEGLTGKPLVETTYTTDWPTFATEADDDFGYIHANGFVKESNQIGIESIPDKLEIVPAEDINSLADRSKDCDDNHDVADITSNKQVNIEDEIYDNKSDPEKLLITSGSQSFVSRDNYVRFTAAKSIDNKSIDKQIKVTKDALLKPEPSRTATETNTVLQPNRGSIRFGPQATFSDLTSFTRRPHKEIAFQNVNLGNGVTLERTKTIRYSTPKVIVFSGPSTASPSASTEDTNNHAEEGLENVTDGVSATTEYPFQSLQSTVNVIRATTYHPNSAENPDLPEIITRRGSLHNAWQWNSQASSDLVKTPVQESFNPSHDQNSPTQISTVSSFVSTLIPTNITSEDEKQEMLERKAEEIFGHLNDTSADMLMNVMNQAESNMTVRRLVLLLVADRNGRENKSFDESRSQLIQALLKSSESTPGLEEATEAQVRQSATPRGRALSVETISTTPAFQSSQSTNKVEIDTSQRFPQKPEPQYLRSPNLFPQNPSATHFGVDPDARAVELLKSLYNLAARWG